MAGKMPQGLVGMLQGKNFIKPAKKAPPKKGAANKSAIARKLAAAKEDAADGGKDDAQENPFGQLTK